MASKQELAVVYAALILEDEGVPINAEKVNKLLQAAGVQVEPFWPGLYVKALEGVNVSELISNLSSGVGSAPAGGAPAASSAAPAQDKPADKPAEKKEAPKEESDDDMGQCDAFYIFASTFASQELCSRS
ncbi:Ribosomal protein [Aphelenchoides besseyi]|nr:Ribosomal protein [Aphelenchoides besseyi]